MHVDLLKVAVKAVPPTCTSKVGHYPDELRAAPVTEEKRLGHEDVVAMSAAVIPPARTRGTTWPTARAALGSSASTSSSSGAAVGPGVRVIR